MDNTAGIRESQGLQSSLFFETPEEIYARVYRELRPRTPLPDLRVEFRRFANADSFIRLENGRLEVRISDLLAGAPAPVMEALAHILLGKLYRKPVRAIVCPPLPPVSEPPRRAAPGAPGAADPRPQVHLGAAGRAPQPGRNLRTFERAILRWLAGPAAVGMEPPAIAQHVGALRPVAQRDYYQPHLRPAAGSGAAVALEYVMFHEMLHLRYPVDHHAARRRVHTREFREAEKKFPQLKEAKEILKRL